MLINRQNYRTQEVRDALVREAKWYIKNSYFVNFLADKLSGDCDYNWIPTYEEEKYLEVLCADIWIESGGNTQEAGMIKRKHKS